MRRGPAARYDAHRGLSEYSTTDPSMHDDAKVVTAVTWSAVAARRGGPLGGFRCGRAPDACASDIAAGASDDPSVVVGDRGRRHRDHRGNRCGASAGQGRAAERVRRGVPARSPGGLGSVGIRAVGDDDVGECGRLRLLSPSGGRDPCFRPKPATGWPSWSSCPSRWWPTSWRARPDCAPRRRFCAAGRRRRAGTNSRSSPNTKPHCAEWQRWRRVG